jgi:hypothetical protein
MGEIGLGLGYSPELTIHDMANYVVEAEKKGFELAFFSETKKLDLSEFTGYMLLFKTLIKFMMTVGNQSYHS